MNQGWRQKKFIGVDNGEKWWVKEIPSELSPRHCVKWMAGPLHLLPICQFVKHGVFRSHFKISQICMSLAPPENPRHSQTLIEPQKPTDTSNDIKWHVAHLPHPVETPDQTQIQPNHIIATQRSKRLLRFKSDTGISELPLKEWIDRSLAGFD